MSEATTTAEDELYEGLRRFCLEDELEFHASSAPYFALLARRFPTTGSKIDWSQVPHSIVQHVVSPYVDAPRHLEAAEDFIYDVIAAQRFDGEMRVVVMNDSAMKGAVAVSVNTLRNHMRSFLLMPQHLYITDAEASWCMVFTMEGDLCFARAPT